MNPMYEGIFFPSSSYGAVVRPQQTRSVQPEREETLMNNESSTACITTAFSRNHYQTRLPVIRASHQRVSLSLDPFEGQLDSLVHDILRSSEECFPEKSAADEQQQQRSNSSLFLPTYTTSTSSSHDEATAISEPSITTSSEDSEWDNLEDPPVTCGFEELPVAASLIQHVDLFASLAAVARTGKRGREVSEDEEEESASEEEEEKSVYGSDSSRDGVSPLEDQWSERFRELTEFKKRMGHCSVPHNYKGNPVLARWVKRQRHQYKQLKVDVGQGKHLPPTIKERVQALHDLGFVFDCQRTAWDEKLQELRDYQSLHLDCNVPSNYPSNPALAMWVKCQRRQYKMLNEGRKSGMTPVRIQQLEEIGFTWELRRYNKKTRMN